MNRINEIISQTIESARKEAVQAVLTKLDGRMTVGEFIDSVQESEFAAQMRAVEMRNVQTTTVRASAKTRARKSHGRSKGRKKGHFYELQKTEEVYDILLKRLEDGPMRAKALKANIPASEATLRLALVELIEKGKVKRTGHTVSILYHLA